MGFDGKMKVTTLEGQEQMVSQGPTAAIVPIKQLGTNGGGYFLSLIHISLIGCRCTGGNIIAEHY